MPDDWGDDFDGDWDLAGGESVLDDELEFDDQFGLGTDELDGDGWDIHGMDGVEAAGVFDDAEVDEFRTGGREGGDARHRGWRWPVAWRSGVSGERGADELERLGRGDRVRVGGSLLDQHDEHVGVGWHHGGS